MFTPNAKYSGPVKPRLSEFIEEPFTTETAELNALRTGNSISVGYLPATDLGQKQLIASSRLHAAERVAGRGASTTSRRTSTNPTTGAIVKQLYFRQAMQSPDQPAAATSRQIFKGYGVADLRAGAGDAGRTRTSDGFREGQPLPVQRGTARKLLTIARLDGARPNGAATCKPAGQRAPNSAGTGSTSGAKLKFSAVVRLGRQPGGVAGDAGA